jgi:hypothetical protein
VAAWTAIAGAVWRGAVTRNNKEAVFSEGIRGGCLEQAGLVLSPAASPSTGAMCLIPANPDISGIGVRVAIYVQNFLSFMPAFYALVDGKVDSIELKTIEDQSTTILVTAFAILISTIVQALSQYGLSDLHTSVILNLSWMNNTNTFIYFILYVHHRSGLTGDSRVVPEWAAWWRHFRQGLSIKRKGPPTVLDGACT